jgi:hypothetical protein
MRLRLTVGCALVAGTIVAFPATASGCTTARNVRGTNPSYAAISSAIDSAAARFKVPPPLLKAIAWKESGWQQFWSDGRAKVSYDCGVGVMQVTGGNWDYNRLGGDYRYNIDAGARVLSDKMAASSANVPAALGSDIRQIAENWYRATYRYNGAGYAAERYADSVFELVRTPPEGIARYAPSVPLTNPKAVVRGYSPTSGHGYVAQYDGTWRSTLGQFRGPVWRADWAAAVPALTARRLEAGQRVAAVLRARNVGWTAWTADRIRVGTSAPFGRASKLRDDSWRTTKAFGRLTAPTPTGGTGALQFTVHAPPTTATATLYETFAPSVDGGTSLWFGAARSPFTIDPAHAPTARITAAPRFATDATDSDRVPITLAGSDPSPGSGVAYYQVRWRRTCDGCAWSAPVRSDATPRVPLRTPGRSAVQARAIDRAGHVGAWSTAKTIVVPHDDGSARLDYAAGWVEKDVAGSYYGSVHASTVPGSDVSATLSGTSFAVIATKQPGGPTVRIYLDGTLVVVANSAASTRQPRRVLWSGTTSAGTHVVRVVTDGNGTAPLALDAIAAS